MSVATMWFILGIVLLAVELVSPAFVLFFFGFGAWAAGVTAESARRENGYGNPDYPGKWGRGDFGGRQFLARGVPGSAAGGGAGAYLGAYP